MTRAVLRLGRRAIRYELKMWASLYRWIFRRPVGPAGAQAFGSTGPVMPVLVAFIGLSVVEIPIFDLIVRRVWPSAVTVRQTLLFLGLYGLLWMVGILAMLRVHPHLLDERGLRVRNGPSIDIALAWPDIASIGKRYRSLPSGKTLQAEPAEAGRVQYVVIAGQSSVDVRLRRPVSIRLPKGISEPVTELRFYADDPDSLIAAARQHLADAVSDRP